VLLSNSGISENHWSELRIMATGLEIALAAASQSRRTREALQEISALQQIAGRILSTGQLSETLFSICRETQRLLSADICGVFLQEDDYMVMRDCVGNHTRDLAKARLRRGQGLAGRVFATGAHCNVNNYLKSEILSQEYADLVRAERIRSALGAPLRVKDELIGVLEVWRRRESAFTEADVRRALVLANLTAMAINNAQLYEKQRSLVEKVTVANENLSRQNEIIRQSAEITNAVMQVLLDGGGLPAIRRVVAASANTDLAFLTCDLQGMAQPPTWLEESLPLIRRVIYENPPDRNRGTVTFVVGERWLSVRSVIAGREHAGWLCALSQEQPGHLQDVAIAQAAMATALNCLEQRAATRARAEILGGIAWDLLEGTAYARQTAATRAKELQIDLQGPLRIVHFTAERLDETECADRLARDRRLKQLQEIFERELGRADVLRLTASRGSLLVAAVKAADGAGIKRILRRVEESMTRELQGLRTFWGVSAPCDNASTLHAAHREAAAAVQLVRKLKLGRNVAVHEELGVVGLLLKIRSDADLAKFVQDILSKVIAQDSRHKNVLTRTVRSYFDCNCAQNATAEMLHIHEKTVRYRLSRFEKLTGVDLDRHEDRMLVDLALRMYEIGANADDAASSGTLSANLVSVE
jgi:DNA-binding PucR family transcriptional regulator